MKGIISTSEQELKDIDKIINDGMKAQDPVYNGTEWGKIIKHPIENKFILLFNEDSRNPRQFLTSNNKLKHIEINLNEWIPPYEND